MRHQRSHGPAAAPADIDYRGDCPGRRGRPEFEKQFDGKVSNQTLQRYIQKVGAKLGRVAERRDVPYEYSLLASDVPNALPCRAGRSTSPSG